MLQLLIIADDFTGALDAGVQFASHGANVKVVTDPRYDFTRALSLDVIVFDAETRHKNFHTAYKIVNNFVKLASKFNIPHVYKKTDSGLRGNIGSELAGAMDALGIDEMAFIPAFPDMKRVTKNGVHYIDGVPVAKSMFGHDPFEPVKNSEVAKIIHEQTDKTGIKIYDADTNEDLLRVGKSLLPDKLRLTAGCAGFAGVLAKLLDFNGTAPEIPDMPEKFFMLCGSVNPVTKQQMDYAQAHGFKRIYLNGDQKLNPSWPGSPECNDAALEWLCETKDFHAILDANNPDEEIFTENYIKSHELDIEQVRLRISRAVSGAGKALLDNGLDAKLMCVGGDTLLALMNAVNIHELIPVCEVAIGVVLTSFEYSGKNYYILTKSGAFGEEDLLVTLAGAI